eukprot:TRINITY_DN3023_c0_g1_i1.p1 TRINITY_DN3023_c0_g1~~TRINITY_DN3023_c0_g1_i1.p1  ORF type:complete len:103 (-),score=10.45 TRINITY_DN3023_c0_g1_i1:41-349(-)
MPHSLTSMHELAVVGRLGFLETTKGASHLDRWRILRRFFCKRRVRFFFHFHRNFERAFLYGFDLCAIATSYSRDGCRLSQDASSVAIYDKATEEALSFERDT